MIHMDDKSDVHTLNRAVTHPLDRNVDTTQNSEYLLTQIGARAARDLCG